MDFRVSDHPRVFKLHTQNPNLKASLDVRLLFTYNLVRGLGDYDPQILTEIFQCATLKGLDLLNVGRHVENVDIYERLTRIENPEDINEIVGIVC